MDKITCENCGKEFTLKKIFKLSWRYNDKERTYTTSKIKMIHTGWKWFCKVCLNKIIK